MPAARPETYLLMRIGTEELKETRVAHEFGTPVDHFPALREIVRRRECDFTDAIHTRLRAARIGGMVEVEGEIRTTVRLSCGRCLAEFTTPLETAFNLTYIRQETPAEGPVEPGPREEEADEAGLIYFHGEEIDLTDGIQEQVILALPFRPLCNENCRGLCAGCGADLNHAACGCRTATEDSPFAVLDRLKLEKD